MKKVSLSAIAAFVIAPSVTYAGMYTDDMTKCLVESTSTEDRISLVRWIFVAMAQHPAVSSLTNVKASDVEEASAKTGALFTKLMTETCVEVTKKAIKYEGPAAIQLSFQVLGQVAARDMFSDANVLKVMASLEEHADQEKIEALSK